MAMSLLRCSSSHASIRSSFVLIVVACGRCRSYQQRGMQYHYSSTAAFHLHVSDVPTSTSVPVSLSSAAVYVPSTVVRCSALSILSRQPLPLYWQRTCRSTRFPSYKELSRYTHYARKWRYPTIILFTYYRPIIGCITRLARPFVRPSVPHRLVTLKQKSTHMKIGINVPSARVSAVSIFS